MKSDIYRKLLRTVAVETFLQLGFERASEQSVNIAADLLAHYLTAQVLRILPYRRSSRSAARILVADFYCLEEYQKDELFQFLDQQLQMRRQPKEKTEDGTLQHALNAIPQEARDAFRTTALRISGALQPDEKTSMKIVNEVPVDGFLVEFITQCNAQAAVPQTVLAEPDGEGILTNGCAVVSDPPSPKPEALRCEFPQMVQSPQELFCEDFASTEKFGILRH